MVKSARSHQQEEEDDDEELASRSDGASTKGPLSFLPAIWTLVPSVFVCVCPRLCSFCLLKQL